jgi:hypothetical protein
MKLNRLCIGQEITIVSAPVGITIDATAEGKMSKRLMITPEVALEILVTRLNPRNDFREARVQELARMMRANRFIATLPIRFAKSGLLVHGTHRLAAVALSKCAIEFEVQFNWEE